MVDKQTLQKAMCVCSILARWAQNNAVALDALQRLGQPAVANNAVQNAGLQNANPGPVTFGQGSTASTAMGPIPGAVAVHPSDMQSEILRIQQNIIESVRQLNAQHEQLEVMHRLLEELNRLQQASGVSATAGQDLASIAPLNAANTSPFVPQAYFARGGVL